MGSLVTPLTSLNTEPDPEKKSSLITTLISLNTNGLTEEAALFLAANSIPTDQPQKAWEPISGERAGSCKLINQSTKQTNSTSLPFPLGQNSKPFFSASAPERDQLSKAGHLSFWISLMDLPKKWLTLYKPELSIVFCREFFGAGMISNT